MSYTLEVREAGPITIVLTHFRGHLTRDIFNDWNMSLDRLSAEYDLSALRRMYSILLVPPGTTTDFATIIEEMRVAPEDVTMAAQDPDVFRLMFVSEQPMVKLAVQLARRKEFFGGQDVPMFRTLEDALAFVAIDRQTVEAGSDQPVQREV